MLGVLLRGLAQIPPLLLGVSLLLFALIHLPPGGPEAVYAAGGGLTLVDMARLRSNMGLDDPLPVQYGKWLVRALQGDLGVSLRDGTPVLDVVLGRLPATLKLMGAALVITLAAAIPAAVFAATHRGPVSQSLVSVLTVVGLSVPTFWTGMLVIIAFGTRLRWIPIGGEFSAGTERDFWDGLRHLVAPALVLGTVNIAAWTRYLHSSLVETFIQDFVRTARAKGLPERLVLGRHVSRHALVTGVTLLGLEVPRLLTGAIVTEAVFSWPGNGRLLVDALLERNYSVLMGDLLLIAVFVMLGNLVADVAHGLVDPRVR